MSMFCFTYQLKFLLSRKHWFVTVGEKISEMTKLKKIVAYTSIVAGVVAIFCAFVSSIHITYFIFSTGSFCLEFQFKKCFHFQFLSEGASNSKHPPTTADPSFTIISDTDKILAGIYMY